MQDTVMQPAATLATNSKKNQLEALSAENAQLIAQFFQVLSDPTRVRLVKALADGQWCVSDLVQALAMDQPAISHQLKYLRRLGFVEWKKRGRHVYYTLNNTLLRSTLLKALNELQVLDV
jgi:ArsR family transcriptional regulator, lead/cadmium/zinc/bismuth-responsive transcriptional repressor